MTKKIADQRFLHKILRLLSKPKEVKVTQTANYDMMGQNLTKEGVCALLIEHLEFEKEITQTEMRGADAGNPGFECKFKIDNKMFYFKMVIRQMDLPEEYLRLVSAHVNH